MSGVSQVKNLCDSQQAKPRSTRRCSPTSDNDNHDDVWSGKEMPTSLMSLCNFALALALAVAIAGKILGEAQLLNGASHVWALQLQSTKLIGSS